MMKQLLLLGAFILILGSRPADAQVSVLPTLQLLRAGYSTEMTPANRADLLNRTAWIHRADGWGLHRKSTGNRCPHSSGISVSCDILVHGPSSSVYDVLVGEEIPAFHYIGVINDPGNFVAPTPDPAPEPPPAPVPVPIPVPNPLPSVDLSEVLNKLQTLEAQLVAHDERLRKHDEEPMWLTKVLSNRYVQTVGAALVARFALP